LGRLHGNVGQRRQSFLQLSNYCDHQRWSDAIRERHVSSDRRLRQDEGHQGEGYLHLLPRRRWRVELFVHRRVHTGGYGSEVSRQTEMSRGQPAWAALSFTSMLLPFPPHFLRRFPTTLWNWPTIRGVYSSVEFFPGVDPLYLRVFFKGCK
jgi:hypothetical protein